MKATTIGIDLAKHLFQLHGVDQHGKTVLKRQLKRGQMISFFSNLPPSLIGMEACGSAHYWANKLQGLGHTVKLMAPQFVKPYVKTNKNDAADAEAICEAVTRPAMRFVPIKSSEQLAILALHRARQGFIKARTAQANQIRGLLAEYGFILPQGITHIGKHVPELLEDSENGLPGTFRHLLMRLHEHLKMLDKQVNELEDAIVRWHKDSAASQTLAQLPGIGPITASALVASIGNAKNFKNGRQLAAWLGLVPRQHSSGGKQNLLGISKRGDSYLRTLLIHGARAVLRVAERKESFSGSWLAGVMARRNPNVAAVAQANKTARIIWALLAHDRKYDAHYGMAA
ncbi:IS110 family transposase [Aeromonas veronii]|uniref:IS110 family transposase n=1 Tax=Aeromonas veronii TaxID=654 RepID=UPI000CCFB7D2|nr:IS110 family transposase [Aeromonas veronii]PNW65712.1 IS110 family transposase [Aeromonas veronii]